MKIAFHSEIITPLEPSYLCGHAIRVHKHESVLDDLYVSLLRIENDKKQYLFVSFDLVGIDMELINQMKIIAEEAGIPEENVIISVVHTHAGPEYLPYNIFSGDTSTGANPGYRDYLVNQFKKALLRCNSWHTVTGSYAETTIEGYYGNRNNINYPSDKKVYLLCFYENKKAIYMIANITCHPTVLGPNNYKISADLFGAIRCNLQEYYKTPVFMMNGAQGDVSNRQYRQGDDEFELQRVASGICNQLYDLKFEPISFESIHIKDITYVLDYEINIENIEKEIARAKHILETESNPDVIKITTSGLTVLEQNLIGDSHVHEEIITRIIKFGDLIIVTVGAEMFSKFSLQIKAAFPNKKLFIWGITDESVGYLVEKDQYGKNYESMTTKIPKGEVEVYVEHIIAELSDFC